MRQINKATLDLIKSFEGLKLKPYLDSAGIPTIGIGTILYPNGKKVTMQDTMITEDQANEYLQFELKEKQNGVEKMLTVPVNDNQFGALVSFAYNVGIGALQKSTLLKLLNAGDMVGASHEFVRWNKAGGKEVAGLTRRREAERVLFLKQDNFLPNGPTNQEIADKLKASENE